MGGTVAWGRARIPEGERLYVASADAECYFFRCGIPPELGRFFWLPPVAPGLVRRLAPRLHSEGVLDRLWHPHFK
eukprot:11197997-Lingulodinium_polyedra.AAC.1